MVVAWLHATLHDGPDAAAWPAPDVLADPRDTRALGRFTCDGREPSITGSGVIVGTSGDDTVFVGAGDDKISLGAGGDGETTVGVS